MLHDLRTKALLVTLGPFAVLGIVTLNPRLLLSSPRPLVAASTAWALTTVAGLFISRRPRLGFALLLTALLAFGAGVFDTLVVSPAQTLLVALLGGILLTGITTLPPHGSSLKQDDERSTPTALRAAAAVVSGTVAFIAWFLVHVGEISRHPLAIAAAAACVATSFAFFVDWLSFALRRPALRWLWLIAAIALVESWLVVSGVLETARLSLGAAALPLAALALASRHGTRVAPTPDSWLEPVLANPARVLVVTFALLSLFGAVLLRLPMASAVAQSVSFIDALFTAVSAVCVTGLTVIDTPGDLSIAGQLVVLCLIQLGGLGIMTLSVATLAILGRRLDMRAEGAAAGLLSGADRGALYGTLRKVLAVTFAAEGLGAAALSVQLALGGEPIARAIYEGLFTSVSAYCNAGFALRSDSLAGFAGRPVFLHTIGVLIITGGLSPIAVLGLPGLARRAPLRLETKLALAVTGWLLVVGALGFAVLEWRGTLASLNWIDKLHNAWFQSVTTRTAGFNSVSMTALHPEAMLLVMLLMFVGGSPGSTAGGIKTTTAAVLWLAAGSGLFRRGSARAFGRKISVASVYKAVAVAAAGFMVSVVALLALLLTQQVAPRLLAFEVMSALGTVGLSMGATTQLDSIGKVILIVCMFLGRVGPLTLLVLLAERRNDDAVLVPEEDVDVG